MTKRPECQNQYNRLKGFLRENQVTYENVAHLLGLTTTTVSMKMNGKSDFYLSEVKAIMDTYNAPTDIFL